MQNFAKGIRGGVWRRLAAHLPFLAALLVIIFLTAIVIAPSRARAYTFDSAMDRIAAVSV